MDSMQEDPSIAALERDLRAVISPEAAFLKASDLSGRNDPGWLAAAEAAVQFWHLLTGSIVGTLVLEIAKGAAGEVGKGIGQEALARWKAWRAQTPSPAQDDAARRAALGDADLVMTEVLSKLAPAERRRLLDMGEADLRKHLEQQAFPASRAARLAHAVRGLAEARNAG